MIILSRLSFSDFASKNSKDARYKGIEKMRDRECLFNEFMSDFKKHEKERMRAREQKVSGFTFSFVFVVSHLLHQLPPNFLTKIFRAMRITHKYLQE